MANQVITPYGAWESPITAKQIAAGTMRLSQIETDGDNIYWKELRPAESGRCVIIRRDVHGKMTDLTPPPYNVRSRVHEYGGGAYLIDNGVLYFSNFSDHQLYRAERDTPPEPITPEAQMRYADGVVDQRRHRIILVREDHTDPRREPVNTIVALNSSGVDTGRMLISGNDFYASPRLSPDGSKLAWLTWNHPHMPWEAAQLWVADINEDGTFDRMAHVAGSDDESIVQPEWSPDNVLHFVSDRTNWWNIYRYCDGLIEPLLPMEAEFARPQWVFGMATYGFADERRIACTYFKKDRWHLATLETSTSRLQSIRTDFTTFDDVRVTNEHVLCVAGSARAPEVVVKIALHTGDVEVLRRASDIKIDKRYFSIPQPIEFSTGGGYTAHAYLYMPTNPLYAPPSEEKPPLLVMSHGGPTSATSPSLKMKTQYYTSRGFAVLDVNYGGSTGYGRAYRMRLKNTWGIVDVDDCVNAAQYAAEHGLVDRNRMAITGGSAGGYTTLSALTFRKVFAAGSSHFGVSDCEALTKETHKFESRYLDFLIGPYPERKDLYAARSPIHHTDQLCCPIIFFQGLEDKVVPPNQAEKMVQALREKGLPVAYVPFEGELHGFRRAENIQRALEAELYFFSRIFGFDVFDTIEPVVIANMDT